MHIITRKRLDQFSAKHPEVKSGLTHWYKIIKGASCQNFAELRTMFPSVDQVGKLFVFNIGGNKVRLIVAIHFNRQKVFIRDILTHSEYDEGKWKE